MDSKTKNRFFTNRQLIVLIIPLIMQLVLDLVVGMVDTVMVSSVGESAISGVSLVDTVMQLIIYIFAAMASGGAVVAGQYLGKRNKERAREAVKELVYINFILGLIIMTTIMLLSNWLLHGVFGEITDEVAFHGQRYLRMVVFSIPAIAVYEAGAASFRTMSNSKITMLLSLLMNVVNCFGNALFIYYFSLGTRGAALSTVISRWLAAVIIISLLLNPKLELYIKNLWKIRFEFKVVKQILSMGVPVGIENGIFQLGKIALLGLVASFGTAAIAANAVTQTLSSIQVIPGLAIQLAIITVISRCVGAEDYEQAKYYNKKLLLATYVIITIISLSLFLGLSVILSFYNLSPETTELTRSMFMYHMVGAVFLWPLAFDLPASLRAAGDVKFPMIISVLSMWAFRLGGAYFLARNLGMGAVGVWASMALFDWGFRALVYSIRWRGGKWKLKKII